jgi:N-methylhydantoinase B
MTSTLTPQTRQAASRRVDPVTLQVLVSRLSGIVQEMQESVFRTGYSTIIRESHDASCMLMDANGDVIGSHAVAPLHAGSLMATARAFIKAFGDTMAPGDAYITNHPYQSGVAHSVDMAVVTPVFYDGRLIAFSGGIAHKSDLGGVIPGTGYGQARELFQEGIMYPPLRLIRRGEWVRDVEAILRANSRTPDLVMGDIRGQVGVARLGEQRLAETVEKYGLPTVLGAFEDIHNIAEERLRAEIASWPDGTFESEAFVDTDGISLDRRIRYHVRVEKVGDRIHFDFSGCDDQVVGPINIRPPLANATIYFALTAFIDPSLPINGGVARVVEATYREGSVLNARYPAAHNTYMASTVAMAEISLQALSNFVPDRRHAGNGGVGGQMIAGTRPDGSPFVQYELVGSAYGGSARRDGASGIEVLLSNGHTAPIEIVESEYPTRVQRFELIPDSGGPGLHRGGLSIRRVYDVRTDDAQWTLRGGRHEVPAFGIDGGKPGRVGSAIRNPGKPDAASQPSRFSRVFLKTGDIAQLEKAGGGGFGDPRQRAFEQVLEDVIDGYVTRASAIADYGADPLRLDAAVAAWESAGA